MRRVGHSDGQLRETVAVVGHGHGIFSRTQPCNILRCSVIAPRISVRVGAAGHRQVDGAAAHLRTRRTHHRRTELQRLRLRDADHGVDTTVAGIQHGDGVTAGGEFGDGGIALAAVHHIGVGWGTARGINVDESVGVAVAAGLLHKHMRQLYRHALLHLEVHLVVTIATHSNLSLIHSRAQSCDAVAGLLGCGVPHNLVTASAEVGRHRDGGVAVAATGDGCDGVVDMVLRGVGHHEGGAGRTLVRVGHIHGIEARAQAAHRAAAAAMQPLETVGSGAAGGRHGNAAVTGLVARYRGDAYFLYDNRLWLYDGERIYASTTCVVGDGDGVGACS